MSLFSRQLLPPFLRNMEQIADILQAIEPELTLIRNEIARQMRELNITTSTTLLPRHERIFAVPVNPKTQIEDRRARLVARLLGQGTTTLEVLIAVIRGYYDGDVGIIEHPHEARFVIELSGPLQMPVDWPNMTAAIEELKPAHLAYDHSFTYQTGTLPIYGGFCLLVGDELEFTQRRPDSL